MNVIACFSYDAVVPEKLNHCFGLPVIQSCFFFFSFVVLIENGLVLDIM